MNGYWVTFTDGSSGYCQGQNAFDAVNIAEHLTKKTVKLPEGGSKYDPKLPSLPYPAKPIIWQFDHPVHGMTPDFCYTPRECAGRTSCPRGPSCTS